MEINEKKVEAVLFAAGKEVSEEGIAQLCSLNLKEVNKIMERLVKEYEQGDHSLKIEKKEQGWKLTVKDEYLPLISNIVSSKELDSSMMQTLAVIAWKFPVVQSEIIKLRGTGAYDHLKQLEEQGFISKEKSGRTFKVKLTQKFFEYFDLPSQEAKEAFLKQIPATVIKEAEETEKEADNVEKLKVFEEKEKLAKDEIKKAVNGVRKE